MNILLKFYGFFMAVILLGAGMCAAAPPPLIRHDLTVRLEPIQQMLLATDIVTIPPLEVSHLVFELAGHLAVKELTLNGLAAGFTFKNGRLRIPWASTALGGRLRIVYGGTFNDDVPHAPLNTDNPGFGVTGTISPEGIMLLAGAKWYPMAQNARSVYNLTVHAPKGVVAVSSGLALGHVTENGRTISRWKVEQPLRGMPLVAGAYQVATRRFGRVDAATYFSAPLQQLSDAYLDAVGRYLQLYEKLFGPYPFGQFAVVENFFPTGYGFPSFTLLGRRVLQLPFIIDTSLGHEIAHCWWGNGVLVDPSQGNWSEGLTTYVSDYLYKERRDEGRAHRLQWLRNYAGLVNASNDFPVSRFSGRVDPATKVVGYDKAAMVFHMLRQTVGEDVFWSTLREIYSRHLFKAISWSDFQAAFEDRSKISLARFFRQWVFRPGAPRLSLSNVTATAAPQGFEVSGMVVQEKPYFDLRLDLVLSTDDDPVSHSLNVSGAQTPFSISVAGRPKELQADPDVHLFRRLWPEEVPPSINTIKGAPAVTVVVAENLDSKGLTIARRLSAALGLRNARIGMEGDFTNRELDRRDLLFVGKPCDRRWFPDDDHQFAVTPDAFALKGRVYGSHRESFFGVFSHPDCKASAVALFIPASLSIAKSLAVKIPHYGKYSYLVFADTRNQVKGTWAVTNSPMVVRWPMEPDVLTGGKP